MNVLFPLLAVLIWSLNAVVSKVSATAIDPAAISFYRWLLALLTLTPFILPGVLRNLQAVKQYWWKLLILGLLGMVLYQSLAYYAAHSVSAVYGHTQFTDPAANRIDKPGAAQRDADCRDCARRNVVAGRASLAGECGRPGAAVAAWYWPG